MLIALFVLIVVFLLVPPVVIGVFLYLLSRRPQHAILRSHPYLGLARYLLEKIGPEFRQYWFDGETEGRPFSRNDFLGMVFAAKYRTDLISFGSRRDYEQPGFYIANDMFPLLSEEIRMDREATASGRRYEIVHEGLFSRRERQVHDRAPQWLYSPEDAVVVGGERRTPWVLKGMFGASATSYGSVGEHYILSTGAGVAMAGGSWINTGEGGVAPEHLETGADVVAQIGPGLFGYRDENGNFSINEFRGKAGEPNIRAFELKFAQGAKIRGGHLEGTKVNAKVAGIRKVKAGETVNSPNRFPFLHSPEEALRFVRLLQEEGGKPVGLKIVVGQKEKLDGLFETMVRLDAVPDFITVDGGEGGSGATFKAMADAMGLPLYPALIAVVDAAHRYGVRERLRIFASGKLVTPDKVAVALAIGADAVNSARGFMIANGCIMAMQCHTGRCPTGVTTTDPHYQQALVPDEKKWRVMNYVIHLRAGLFALAAASGLASPREFRREHVIYKNEYGRTARLSDLFPLPIAGKEVLGEAESAFPRPVGQ